MLFSTWGIITQKVLCPESSGDHFMEYTISDQLRTFVFSLVCGLIIGFLYEFIRLVRLCFFKGRVALFVLDLLFMVVTAFVTVLYSICYTKGITRYSTLVGEFAAFLLVRFTFGRISSAFFIPLCLKISKKVSEIAVNMGKVIKKLLQVTVHILYNKPRKELSFDTSDSNSDL